MKTKPLIQAVRAGALDLTRELGLALQHLEDLRELEDTNLQQAAEDLASARECMAQVSLLADRMADQLEKAEQVVAREQRRGSVAVRTGI